MALQVEVRLLLDVERALARDGRPANGLTVIGLPAWNTAKGPVLAEGLPTSLGTMPLPSSLESEACDRAQFSASPGQALTVAAGVGEPTVVVLGLGNPATADAERWRRAAAALVRVAGRNGTAALVMPAAETERFAAVTEGARLSAYRYDEFRSEPRRSSPDLLVLIATDVHGEIDGLAAAVRRGTVAAEATEFARDLINRPAGELSPRQFAERVVERMQNLPGVKTEVWEDDRIREERLGALLGVSSGSRQPPRFLRVKYTPTENAAVAHLALVGKGITFDSGGLSLKTAEGMITMKTDMSGAASVMAATWACAREGLPVEVTALAPLTENMPGAEAIKPGDVLTARNGTTIEVLNTDAEGRLVLADALCLAAEAKPDAIIDLATLTGAARVALGPLIAPIYGTTERLVGTVRSAGQRAGEQCWEMPLPDEYRDHLDSDVADIKNIGRPGQAGSIVAALFLSRFADDVPWAHLDIAATARSEESTGYLTKGGTGFGVRTLLELLRSPGALLPLA